MKQKRVKKLQNPVPLPDPPTWAGYFHFWWDRPGPSVVKQMGRICYCFIHSFVQGGCWMAAEGLQLYVERSMRMQPQNCPSVETRLLTVNKRKDRPVHVVLSVLLDGEERLLDAEGIWVPEHLLAHWKALYPDVPTVTLASYDVEALYDVGVPFEWDGCDAVADQLMDVFGPFTPQMVFADGPASYSPSVTYLDHP